MLKKLIKLLAHFGNSKPKDTYRPDEHDAQWINRGTEDDERWEWQDKRKHKTMYANVVKSRGGYTIIVDEERLEFAHEIVQCKDARELEIAVSLLTSKYEVFGKVSITKPVKV